jgi:energy-coupling factor transporter ATP-binding protein EcfA2
MAIGGAARNQQRPYVDLISITNGRENCRNYLLLAAADVGTPTSLGESGAYAPTTSYLPPQNGFESQIAVKHSFNDFKPLFAATQSRLQRFAPRCPYRGLEPFREEDAPFLYGRDDAIRELVAQVQSNTFVAVVGPSGSGKSSLVFAGLLLALRNESPTRKDLARRVSSPRCAAIASVCRRLWDRAGKCQSGRDRRLLEREAGFYRADDAETLARIIEARIDGAPEHERLDRLLVYVDQWEELYAMAPPAEDKDGVPKHSGDVEKFIALLVAASARARASVVLTVRADFYNPFIRNPLLGVLLPGQQ